MKPITYKLSLDCQKSGIQAVIYVKKGDTQSRSLVITLTEGGKTYHIEEGCTASIKAVKPDNTQLYNVCTIDNDTILYTITTQTISDAGEVICEILLSDEEGAQLSTPGISIIVEDSVYDDAGIESTNEYNVITAALAEANAYLIQIQNFSTNDVGALTYMAGAIIKNLTINAADSEGETVAIIFDGTAPTSTAILATKAYVDKKTGKIVEWGDIAGNTKPNIKKRPTQGVRDGYQWSYSYDQYIQDINYDGSFTIGTRDARGETYIPNTNMFFGKYSLAAGTGNMAGGDGSATFGTNCKASQGQVTKNSNGAVYLYPKGGLAAGYEAVAGGNYSGAIGTKVTTTVPGSFIVGRYGKILFNPKDNSGAYSATRASIPPFSDYYDYVDDDGVKQRVILYAVANGTPSKESLALKVYLDGTTEVDKLEVLNGSQVPTADADDNSTAIANTQWVRALVNSAVSAVYKYKGSVADEEALPTTDLTIGDVYNIVSTGANVAWDGTAWDSLGASVDLSNYLSKDNETVFIPTGDYNPASKKYVDDKVAEALEQLPDTSAGLITADTYTDLPVDSEDGAIVYVREDSLVGGIAVPPDLSYTEGVDDKQYAQLYIKESPPRPIYPFGEDDISNVEVTGDASSYNGSWVDFYLSIMLVENSESVVVPLLVNQQYLYSWESESVVVDIVGSGNTEEMITLSPGWNELDDIDYPTEATPVNFADIQSFFEDANIYVGDLYQIPEQAVADLENCLYVYNPTPTEYRRGWYSYSVSEGWERIPDGDYITVIENYESDTIRLSPKHNHNYYFGEISEIFVPHMPEGHYCTSIQFTTHPEYEFYFEQDEPILWDGGIEPAWELGKRVIVTIRDGVATAVMGG